MSKKYRVRYTVTFEAVVESDNPEDAASDAPIPEGDGAFYVRDSFEVASIEEVTN